MNKHAKTIEEFINVYKLSYCNAKHKADEDYDGLRHVGRTIDAHGKNEEKRPDDITVHLLRDGEVYATETLNEANGWSCEWRGLTSLDKDGNTYEWNLIEDAVEGYSPTMEQSGITFVLTNTYEEEIPEDPTPLAPAEPGKPGEPDEPLEELPEDPVPLAMLPQTGMLWWPVPVMVVLGVMFLALGASFRRRENA